MRALLEVCSAAGECIPCEVRSGHPFTSAEDFIGSYAAMYGYTVTEYLEMVEADSEQDALDNLLHGGCITVIDVSRDSFRAFITE